MTTSKAKEIAKKYGVSVYYDRSAKCWIMNLAGVTRFHNKYRISSHFLNTINKTNWDDYVFQYSRRERTSLAQNNK